MGLSELWHNTVGGAGSTLDIELPNLRRDECDGVVYIGMILIQWRPDLLVFVIMSLMSNRVTFVKSMMLGYSTPFTYTCR